MELRHSSAIKQSVSNASNGHNACCAGCAGGGLCYCNCHKPQVKENKQTAPRRDVPDAPNPFEKFKPAWAKRKIELNSNGVPLPPSTEELFGRKR
jgi:hypothetical protein